MERANWINQEDSIISDWQVDVAFDQNKEFSVGRLYVTDQQIQIEAAGGLCHLGDIREELPLNEGGDHLIAPYDQIKSVEIQKHFLLLNYLILTLKSNHLVTFKFGFESAVSARQSIMERLA